MKKFAGLAAVGVGAFAAVTSVTAQAATPVTHISGNLQYTNMQYFCDNGVPNFIFAYRTLNKTEAKIVFSASGFRSLVDTNVAPYTPSQTIKAIGGYAGKAVTVTAKASTTGSSFSVSGKVPATCAGLPSSPEAIDWKAAGKPTAKPVPSTTKPAPTKPAPTKPVPTKPAPTAPAPTAPTAPTGPKVDTDLVRPADSNSAPLAAATLAGAAALTGGGAVVARRRRR